MTLEETYRANFRYVWRTLRRLGVADVDASDAAQDVFLVVQRRLPEFEGRAKMTTWLFRICLRVASERRRSGKRRREQPLADSPEPTMDPADDAAQLLQRREQVQLVESLLDELSDEQRAVLVLFELEELDGDAIAETLEIPSGTVRSRLRLAREAFRQALVRRTARERFVEAGRRLGP